MRLFVRFTMALAVLAVGVTSLQAQYVEAYKIDTLSKKLPEAQVLTVFSTHLGVSADKLKQEKSETGLGLGQLYIAHSIAKLTKSDFQALVSLNKTKSWGEIAKEKNVKMKEIDNDVDKLEKDLNGLSKAQASSNKSVVPAQAK